MDTINWDELEIEYITTKTTYRKLAEQHGVARSTLERQAKERQWTIKRRQYWDNIKANALARAGAREEDKLVALQEIADKMVNQLGKIMKDSKQFRRHVAEGYDETGNVNIVEAVVDKYDMKAIKNFTGAMREMTGVIRDLYELYPEPVKQQMKINRDKIKLEKEKVKILREDKLPDVSGEEFGVIEIAEKMEPPQEEGEEGAEDMDTTAETEGISE
ncbi:MAG: hypothetical protein K6G85_00130 [Eubacterium sp.]|nr:hypothetical protein [Eubacterium sp.]